jgi:hypothetical protein
MEDTKPAEETVIISKEQEDSTEKSTEQFEKNEFVDKLTLELLMNKNHYQRYISQTNPKRYAEIQEYHDNIELYREQIDNLTNDMLNDPQKQITTDVNEAFENYMKTLIKYFQMKKLEGGGGGSKKSSGYDEDDDDEVLFGNMTQTDRYAENISPSKSFWSKEKVVKQTDPYYSMKMFSKRHL